jgi:hypothetical protein
VKEWFTAAELAAAQVPQIARTKRGVNKRAVAEGWTFRDRTGRGGGREFHISSLPVETQAAILIRSNTDSACSPTALSSPRLSTLPQGAGGSSALADDARRSALWSAYDRKPDSLKRIAADRLAILQAVDRLVGTGSTRTQAVAAVSFETKTPMRNIWRWWKAVEGEQRHDWLAALAPQWCGRTVTAEVSAEAWDFFKADYLRLSQPTAESCWRRLQEAAAIHGWTLPKTVASLLRRINREFSPAAIAMARRGREAAIRTMPAQRRDHGTLHALEGVNADFHKFDVFVKWSDGEVVRPQMCAWQDIHSGKILAWRLAKAPNAATTRLALADLVEAWGVPDHAWLDNGREFASKWITGGTPHRHRFKVRDDEPTGVLTMLQVQVHWATPYHGQAKPIERAFRDFAHDFAKHPQFEGAYTGHKPDAKPENYQSRAVPLEEFRQLLAQEVIRHNARPGRLSRVCAGRSFDQAFEESYSAAMIRRVTLEQRRMMLLAANGVTANRSDGSLRLYDNVYWCDALSAYGGQKLVARFDPDDLTRPVYVYTLDGRFIAAAELQELAGFYDVAASQDRARAVRDKARAARDELDADRRLAAADLKRYMPRVDPPAAPEQPKVVRPVFAQHGNAALAVQPEVMSEEERRTRFSRFIQQERQRREEGFGS